MPDQSLTCAQIAALNGGFLEQTIQRPAPDGSGAIMVDVRYTPDGTSTRPNCDGPVVRIRTQNTSGMTCWVLLPRKRRGDRWVQIDPGTDVTISNQGQLNQIGIETFSDASGTDYTYSQPG